MKLKNHAKPTKYAPALRDGVEKVCHVWWEYDGWRIEVYYKGEPQCLGDNPISNDQNLSTQALAALALARMNEEGLEAEGFKVIRPQGK